MMTTLLILSILNVRQLDLLTVRDYNDRQDMCGRHIPFHGKAAHSEIEEYYNDH